MYCEGVIECDICGETYISDIENEECRGYKIPVLTYEQQKAIMAENVKNMRWLNER